MKTIRPRALLAAVLVLAISACSQVPEDLTTPMLEPQFGTADNDRPVDVATASAGRIYSLAVQTGPTYADAGDGTSYQDGSYSDFLLRRYEANGTLLWTKKVASHDCTYDQEAWEECTNFMLHKLEADPQGNTYSLMSYSYTAGDCAEHFSSYVNKLDAAGNYQGGFSLGSTGGEFGASYSTSVALAVDGSGNVYVGYQQADVDSQECTSGNRTNVVAKYSTTGTLLWQRTSTVGTPTDIAVSGSGSVYVVGSQGMARHTNAGGLTWTKPGNFKEVIVSGSNLYIRSGKDIRKYDGTGRQLWLKTQSGLNTIVLQDMDGDGNGNVYLSGKYDADARTNVLNMNAMVRKLSANGSVLWTKTYGTPAYDDANGIATITGSEIYTTGLTKGSLAHTNIGGEDGYLRKQNSTGGLVWTR